jgi:hypothetical protein
MVPCYKHIFGYIFDAYACIWMRNGIVSLGIFLEVLLLYITCYSEWL